MDIRNWRLLQYELSYGCIKKINVHKQSFTGSFFRWLTVFLFKFKAGARLIPALKLKSNTITGSKSKLCSVCSLISLQYSTKKMVRAVKTRVNVCSNLQAQKRKFSCFLAAGTVFMFILFSFRLTALNNDAIFALRKRYAAVNDAF